MLSWSYSGNTQDMFELAEKTSQVQCQSTGRVFCLSFFIISFYLVPLLLPLLGSEVTGTEITAFRKPGCRLFLYILTQQNVCKQRKNNKTRWALFVLSFDLSLFLGSTSFRPKSNQRQTNKLCTRINFGDIYLCRDALQCWGATSKSSQTEPVWLVTPVCCGQTEPWVIKTEITSALLPVDLDFQKKLLKS